MDDDNRKPGPESYTEDINFQIAYQFIELL